MGDTVMFFRKSSLSFCVSISILCGWAGVAHAEMSTISATIPWQGQGQIFPIAIGKLRFLGAIEGIMYVETADIANKANFDGLVFELEAFDSVSDERLVAIIDHLGGIAEEPKSWEDVDALMIAYGELIGCRFENARLSAEQRVDCLAAD